MGYNSGVGDISLQSLREPITCFVRDDDTKQLVPVGIPVSSFPVTEWTMRAYWSAVVDRMSRGEEGVHTYPFSVQQGEPEAEHMLLSPMALMREYLRSLRVSYWEALIGGRYPDFVGQAPAPTITLAGIVFDYAIRHWYAEVAIPREIKNGEIRKDSKKQEIKARPVKLGQKNKKVKQVADDWVRDRDFLLTEQEAYRVIRNQAIIDWIRGFVLDPEGAELLATSVVDLRINTHTTDEEMIALVHHAGEFIRSNGRDPEVLQQLQYKNDQLPLCLRSATLPLQHIVSLYYSEETQEPLQLALEQVAGNLIEMYFQDAQRSPGLFVYYVHDILLAASLTQDTKLVYRCFEDIFTKIAGTTALSKLLMNGLTELFKVAGQQRVEYTDRLIKRVGRYSSVRELVEKLEHDSELAEHASSHRGYLVSPEYDVSESFVAILALLDSTYVKFGRNILNTVDPNSLEAESAIDSGYTDSEIENALVVWKTMLALLNPEVVRLGPFFENVVQMGVKADLAARWMTPTAEAAVSRRRFLDAIIKDINRFGDSPPLAAQHVIVDYLLQAMFIESAPKDRAQMIQLQEENRMMLEMLKTNSKWFVASIGDGFYVEENPELAQYLINSLVLYLPPQFRTGHRVEIQSSIPHPRGDNRLGLTLFIDNNGVIYYNENSKPIDLPVPVLDLARNLILKYLTFITSGLSASSSTPTDTAQESRGSMSSPQASRRPVGYRRAHYVVLTPTEQRSYSLTSQAVLAHHEYVLATYGVNKYIQRLLFIQAGIIRPDQFLTFRRETIPQNADSPPVRHTYKENNGTTT